jgi:hypothetical protein
MKLIALYSSAPRSGKSTAAAYLTRRHSYVTLKFAFPLKKMLGALLEEILPFGQVDDHLEGSRKEAPIMELGGHSARRLMQTLGTEWGRAQDPQFWVNIMDARLRGRFSHDHVVIDDMRFPNEYAMLRARGAYMVKIEDPQARKQTDHASEGALDGHAFDATIQNTGSLDDLYNQIAIVEKTVHSHPLAKY